MKQYVLTAAAVKANRAIEQSANGPSSANLTLITFKNGKKTMDSLQSNPDALDVWVHLHQEKESSFETQMQGQ